MQVIEQPDTGVTLYEGRFYISRDGLVVGPLQICLDENGKNTFVAEDRRNIRNIYETYNEKGVCHSGESEADLVVQIDDPLVERHLTVLFNPLKVDRSNG